MILVEIGEPSLQRQNYNEDWNQESLGTSLDLLIELQEKALIRNMAVKQRRPESTIPNSNHEHS